MDHCNNCNIVYDERKCPLCNAKGIIESLESQVEELQSKVLLLESEKSED